MSDKLSEDIHDFLNKIQNSNTAITYADKCFDKTTPPHEISISGIYEYIFSLYPKLQKKDKDSLKELTEQLKTMLIDKGYRTGYLTYQEQCLRGNTYCSIHKSFPYTSLGIIDGTLSIDEANTARMLIQKEPTSGHKFQINTIAYISLEPLDTATGQTMQDPQILDEESNIIQTTDIPFQRDI